MKVVLLQDVKKMGKKGDVVEVSDGYGRNVLIRKGLGVEGTKANLNTAAQRQESKVFKDQVAADEAVIMAAQLKKVKVVIKVQCGEDGRIFGSVTGKDVADVLKKAHQIDIDKRKISIKNEVTGVGTYDAIIKVHPEITSTIKVHVVAG